MYSWLAGWPEFAIDMSLVALFFGINHTCLDDLQFPKSPCLHIIVDLLHEMSSAVSLAPPGWAQGGAGPRGGGLTINSLVVVIIRIQANIGHEDSSWPTTTRMNGRPTAHPWLTERPAVSSGPGLALPSRDETGRD